MRLLQITRIKAVEIPKSNRKYKDGRRMPGGVRLPFVSPELADRIRAYAAKHNMTVTEVCYLALNNLLDKDPG